MRDLLVMAVIYGMLPFAFRLPWVGVLMWCWVALMNPHQLAYGTHYMPVAQMVGIATLAGFVLFRENTRSLPMRTPVWLMLGLWIWAGVTAQTAFHPEAASELFSQTTKMILFVMLSLMLFQDVRRLRWLLVVIVGSVSVFAVKGAIFALATGGQHMIFGPPNTRMYDNNDLALAMNMALPFTLFFARTWATARGRFLWAGVSGCTVLAVLFTYSRGGVVALAAVLGVTLLRSKQRLPAAVAVVIVLVAALAFAPQAWTDRVSSIADFQEDDSVAGRFNSWWFAWNLALDRPLVGGGFGTFTADIFQIYAPDPETVFVAHSIYFDSLATLGFPGLLMLLSLLVSVLWRSERLRREALRRQASWFAGCAEAMQLSTVAFIVGGAFLSQTWHEIFFHFAAALVVLEVLAEPVVEAEVADSIPAWRREATPCAA